MHKRPIGNTMSLLTLAAMGAIIAICIYSIVRVDEKRLACVERGGVPVTLMLGRVECATPPRR